MLDLATRLRVVVWANDALDCIREHNIGDLIARKECTSQCAAIDGNYEDFFCGFLELWGMKHPARLTIDPLVHYRRKKNVDSERM